MVCLWWLWGLYCEVDFNVEVDGVFVVAYGEGGSVG